MSFELHPDLQRDGILIGRFPLCLLLLINDSAYPWFVLVPQRDGIRETIDLNEPDYLALWRESAELGKSLMKMFAGDKLNIAALGNMTPQLHVHHIVRFKTDPAWPAPIWGRFPMTPYRSDQIQRIQNKFRESQLEGLLLQ